MNEFRKKFIYPNLPIANWYPGHMAKGVKNISRKLQNCDCILEVHDARLADESNSKQVIKELKRCGEREVLFSNMRKQHHRSVRELMKRIRQITRGIEDKEAALQLMVVGMPNVGKSSLINALRRNYLRKGKATAVGKLPGVTRSVLFKIRVSEHPDMFLLDTPGVMMPNITSHEVALKLAIAGILQDNIMDERLIADYLLFVLNQHEQFEYAKFYGLPEPIDNIEVVLSHIAQRLKALTKGGGLDIPRAAQHFILKYRNGELGRITLDQIGSESTSEPLVSIGREKQTKV